MHAGTGTRRTGANLNAVGIELVQPRRDDPFPPSLLERCLDLVADICRRHGIPPLRVHTDAEPGIHGHQDLTPAKSDPGPRFPWSTFLEGVRARLEPPALPADARPDAEVATRLAQVETRVRDLQARLREHRHRVSAATTDAAAAP